MICTEQPRYLQQLEDSVRRQLEEPTRKEGAGAGPGQQAEAPSGGGEVGEEGQQQLRAAGGGGGVDQVAAPSGMDAAFAALQGAAGGLRGGSRVGDGDGDGGGSSGGGAAGQGGGCGRQAAAGGGSVEVEALSWGEEGWAESGLSRPGRPPFDFVIARCALPALLPAQSRRAEH